MLELLASLPRYLQKIVGRVLGGKNYAAIVIVVPILVICKACIEDAVAGSILMPFVYYRTDGFWSHLPLTDTQIIN